MNSFSFEECQIGKKEVFNAEVTEEKMENFREMSGDINPLHINESFAVSKGFKGRVVYGLLVASFFSTLVGVYLPGEKCLIQEVSYKFMKPVYPGDQLEVSGEVIDHDQRSQQLMLKVRIRRKTDNSLLVRGKMTVGVLEN